MMPRVLDRLADVTRSTPEAVALDWEGAPWSFERLLSQSAELADTLDQSGAAGRRVAVDLPTCPEHIMALLAVLQVGATAVPFDPKWSAEQVALRADLCEVSHVLSLGQRGVQVETRHGSGAPVEDGTPFLMAPTGGTSGVPKAIAISEDSTLARFAAQAVEFGFSRTSTFLSATPLFHGGGRSFVLSQLYYGGSVILQPGFDLAAYREALPRAELAFAVPTMVRRLASDPEARSVGTSLLVSGAPAGADLGELLRLAGFTLAHDYYASVEAGPIAIQTYRDGAVESSRLAFGVHLPELPPEPIDEAGVVLEGALVVGHGVADGVLEGESFHAYPTIPDRGRAVRMADLVRIRPGLRPSVEGRTDDVIITGGVNVFPAEVEDVLRQVDGVLDAIVVGLPDAE